MFGLQSRVDVVGVVFVGLGGETVPERDVERLTLVVPGGIGLRSGAACLQAERQEWLRCCPPTYFDLAFDASGVRLKLLFRSVP